MIKKIIGLLLVLCLLSCSVDKTHTKENCESRAINAVFLKKYLIITDTCNTFNTFNTFKKVKYFDNSRLLMTGFSERRMKQGKWVFYNLKEQTTKGFFKDSQPKGNWNFNVLGVTSWKLYKNLEKCFYFSLPYKWEILESKETNSIIVFDDQSNSETYNLRFVFTSVKLEDIEGSIKSLYENSIKNFKLNNFKNIKYKKIIMDDILNEFYEIQYYEYNDKIEYFTNEFLFSLNNRLYILSTSININAHYDYKIIKEIMETSFKVYKDS